MPGDISGLPIAGRALFAGVAYAVISLFLTGPLIGERLVAKMNWAGQCARHIQAETRAAEPPATTMPRLGCDTLIGMWFGREGQDFCAVHGETIDNNPITGMLNEAEEAERKAQEQRMNWAVSRAGSRCDCAVTTTLEESRVDLALHAGSGRLITPPSIRMLGSDLEAALNTPACAMKG